MPLGRNLDRALWAPFMNGVAQESPELVPHLVGVAQRAVALASQCGRSEEDASLLYVAGLMHDVGKLPSHAHVGFHPVDGAVVAERYGLPRVALLVAHHTGSRYEARMYGVSIPYLWRPADLHDLLMLADLTTAPDGQVVGLADRRVDIERRYAPTSIEVRSLHELWPSVIDAATRLHLQDALGIAGSRREHLRATSSGCADSSDE